MNGNCNKLGCEKPGRFRPILLLHLQPPHLVEYTAELLHLLLCDEHRAASAPGDFITDEGWQTIVSAFLRHKRIAPERSRTTLGWREVFVA